MEIHKYEKAWLVGALVLIVFFISTVAYVTAVTGVDMVDESGGTIHPDDVSDDERFGDPRVEQVGENEFEVYMVALQFIFRPDPVEVPEGSEVTFYITSDNVVHGYQIVGTNVNTMVIPGQIAEITVEFDEAGEYGVLCNEYCGIGHADMEGKVIVHPEDEWEEMQGGDD